MTARVVATAGSPLANSYLTVAEAAEILSGRLYTTKWDAAGSTPSADDWVVDGAHAGAETVISIAGGTGAFTVGTQLRFADLEQVYAVTAVGVDEITIDPPLVDALLDGDEVVRITASDREKSVLWATALLDGMMDWKGVPKYDDQSLRWPRAGVYDRDDYTALDDTTIPYALKEATAELALALLDKDRFSPPALLGQGFDEAQVGSLRVKVSKEQIEQLVPANVLSMIEHLGTLAPSASTSNTNILKLERA